MCHVPEICYSSRLDKKIDSKWKMKPKTTVFFVFFFLIYIISSTSEIWLMFGMFVLHIISCGQDFVTLCCIPSAYKLPMLACVLSALKRVLLLLRLLPQLQRSSSSSRIHLCNYYRLNWPTAPAPGGTGSASQSSGTFCCWCTGEGDCTISFQRNSSKLVRGEQYNNKTRVDFDTPGVLTWYLRLYSVWRLCC